MYYVVTKHLVSKSLGVFNHLRSNTVKAELKVGRSNSYKNEFIFKETIE